MRDDSDKAAAGQPEGDDRLASLYRGLGDEEPPAALDAAILRAAREDIDRASAAATRRRAAYSIAASLLLSVTAVLMFSRLELFGPAPFSPEEASPPVALDSESPRLPQIVPQSPIAPPLPVLEPLRLQLPSQERGDAVVSNSPLPPPAQRANTAQEALRADTAEIREERELAEIVVTGSRIVRPYRENPDRWLEQIQSLLDQGRGEEAEEELGLFRERYPEREVELDVGDN